jgi:transcriptional repressor NrdR
MRCPFCSFQDTQVKDSRPSDDGNSIRRRRYCPACDSRFTTFERVQLRELTVVKRNGEKKAFDRDKITRSIVVSTRKRPITEAQIEAVVDKIVSKLEKSGESEVSAAKIGEEVMNELSKLDKVAYVRFASVYKDFSDTKDFEDFVNTLKKTDI